MAAVIGRKPRGRARKSRRSNAVCEMTALGRRIRRWPSCRQQQGRWTSYREPAAPPSRQKRSLDNATGNRRRPFWASSDKGEHGRADPPLALALDSPPTRLRLPGAHPCSGWARIKRRRVGERKVGSLQFLFSLPAKSWVSWRVNPLLCDLAGGLVDFSMGAPGGKLIYVLFPQPRQPNGLMPQALALITTGRSPFKRPPLHLCPQPISKHLPYQHQDTARRNRSLNLNYSSDITSILPHFT